MVLSMINSTVFNLCPDFASYLKRTQSKASPLFDQGLGPSLAGFEAEPCFHFEPLKNMIRKEWC